MKILIFNILMLFFCINTFSQHKKNQEALQNIFASNTTTKSYNNYLKQSNNELEFTVAVLFVAYKKLLSSQDMQSCVFYPSCSVYAIECLGHEAFPKSIFKIFDRLSRCHPLASPKYYHIHSSGQLYDPVKE